jgi:hypothetical protein
VAFHHERAMIRARKFRAWPQNNDVEGISLEKDHQKLYGLDIHFFRQTPPSFFGGPAAKSREGKERLHHTRPTRLAGRPRNPEGSQNKI